MKLLGGNLRGSHTGKSWILDWSERTFMSGWERLCVSIRHNSGKDVSRLRI